MGLAMSCLYFIFKLPEKNNFFGEVCKDIKKAKKLRIMFIIKCFLSSERPLNFHPTVMVSASTRVHTKMIVDERPHCNNRLFQNECRYWKIGLKELYKVTVTISFFSVTMSIPWLSRSRPFEHPGPYFTRRSIMTSVLFISSSRAIQGVFRS